jgi:hypothetical protein
MRQLTQEASMQTVICIGSFFRKRPSALVGVLLLAFAGAHADEGLPEAKYVPALQVIPLPYHQASFQAYGQELTRYHFGPDLNRPFLYPVIGPAGRSLTRMGHPHDPESHSHHNSVWISHNDLDGLSFWSDSGAGKIRHTRIIEFEDTDEQSFALTENEWLTKEGRVLLKETRRIAVVLLGDYEWLLIIDMEFEPADKPVTLGKTPFGMIGVRMAKTIGVNDGGGRIRNSSGGVNEKQILWKRARWVDYSGPVKDYDNIEGITLFDHPDNPNYPSYFHVRDDGWMGASLTFDGPRKIEPKKPLRLRYGLYVHIDMPPAKQIEAEWKRFTQMPQVRWTELSKKR